MSLSVTVAVAKTSFGYYQNVVQAYDFVTNAPTFETEVKEAFRQLSCELTQVEASLSVLIQGAHVHTQYAAHETTIREAMQCHSSYLQSPSEHWKRQFIQTGESLRIAVRTLLEAIAKQRTFGFDIIQSIIDDEHVKGRPGRMRKRIDPIVALINQGILLHAAYVKLSGISIKDNAPTAEALTSLYKSAAERIEEEIEKREREDIQEDMVAIMERNSSSVMVTQTDREAMATKLYEFLSDRFDSRQWIVIVHEPRFGYHRIDVTYGARFHQVTVCGSHEANSVLAVSFPLDQKPPVNFYVPLHVSGSTTSAGLLVKALNEYGPGNHYVAMRIDGHQVGNRTPAVIPKNSPLVKEFLVGTILRVYAFPKDHNMVTRHEEDNVHHEIVEVIQQNNHSGFFTSPDRNVLATKLHEHLSQRYRSRQWLVIVHPLFDEMQRSSITFGVKYHRVVLPVTNSGNSHGALAVSYPFNQPPPVECTPPSDIPLQAFAFSGIVNMALSVLPAWAKESTGLVVKSMNEKEPRNCYFAMHVAYPGLLGGDNYGLPAVIPKNSPLLKELRVGKNLRVFVFPKN